jgi:hypothetical protein
MNENEVDTAANLRFFRSAILEPTLEHQEPEYFINYQFATAGYTMHETMQQFSVIEAANWLRLGARIGYFEENEVRELNSSSDRELNAKSYLQSRGIVFPDLPDEALFEGMDVPPRTVALLHNAFQMFILLTSENILDRHTRYFLETIGWGDDQLWIANKQGTGYSTSGSGTDSAIGFSNVLNYWQEMSSACRALEEAHSYFQYQSVFGGSSILFPPDERDQPVARMVATFTWRARAIMCNRFNLSRSDVGDRYFVLAGEFANRGREDSPAWLDARCGLFEQLFLLIDFADAATTWRRDVPQLWSLFTTGVRLQLSYETKPAQVELDSAQERQMESPGETL